MKRSFLKIVLPAFAIIMAVGLAFATEETTVPAQGHYLDPINGWQTVTVDPECIPNGEDLCTYEGFQLYAEQSETSPKLGRD
ncbi:MULTISPECIES: DUF6520 family protein [Maribacter]|uniref:DUF6520 family protein n=1 Tax=Maribacter flavus TaxID=1658664 RepID=A0ABU7IKE3_9FLAO|nr:MULTISPECIES: DUF6520 family protein [Maribacter]MDC6406313.1 DUF6520 family protein [Maribacter sp. PR66]MEE1973433.1 DUF6520 family protein [Maribacter flavus]